MLNNFFPWMTYKAIDFLESYLKPDMKVFEYGTGDSTLFFSYRVKEVVSVEHDKDWNCHMRALISEYNRENIQYFLKEPESGEIKTYSYDSYTSSDSILKDKSFKKYVIAIDDFPDKYFNLISIDGRARPSCLAHSINKIANGGIIVIDNTERDEYNPAINKFLNAFERLDFFGPGPKNNYSWQTSIWKI